MKKKWLQICIILGVMAFVTGNIGQAKAVTITETMDQVFADSAHHYENGLGVHLWPVVRFDVTNNDQALGVYSIMVGAKPGDYEWAGNSEPAMLFGSPWEPVGARDADGNLPYLPQMDNGDGKIDWTTTLLQVQNSSGVFQVNAYDLVTELDVTFNLPDTFAGYEYVYWFETTGPFVACSGDCYRDSVPIGMGDTFSFYVTGGLGSPFLYLTSVDYNQNGSLQGTYSGSGMTSHGGTNSVPEPATMLLFGIGLAGLVGISIKRKSK